MTNGVLNPNCEGSPHGASLLGDKKISSGPTRFPTGLKPRTTNGSLVQPLGCSDNALRSTRFSNGPKARTTSGWLSSL